MLSRRIDLRGISPHDRLVPVLPVTTAGRSVATREAADGALPAVVGDGIGPATKRVLVVAEQPNRALQLRTILTFAGFDTCLCRTVSDAVLAIRSLSLDAAVIDLGMAAGGTTLTSAEFAFVARASCGEDVIIGVVLPDVDKRLDRETMRQYGIDFTIEEPFGVNMFRRAIASREFS